jgi:cell wall-associated NlpC family hydrolase
MPYQRITASSGTGGYQPLTGGGGTPVLGAAAAPVAPQSDQPHQGPLLGFWHGLGNLVSGVTAAVATPVHDIGHAVANAIPGQQGFGIINDQPGNSFKTDDLLKGMFGTAGGVGGLNLATDIVDPGLRSKAPLPPILQDYVDRYGGLVGYHGTPASTFSRFWNDPVPYLLDASAVGSAAGKAADASAKAALATEDAATAAAKAASVTDELIAAGTKGSAAQAAGLRAGLDDLATTKELSPAQELARKILPDATVKLVKGRGLVPTAQTENVVNRAMLSPLRRLLTEPLSATEDRVAQATAQAGNEIANWGGVQRPTMGSLDELQSVLDKAKSLGLQRIEKPVVSEVSAWRDAQKFELAQRGAALGARIKAQRTSVNEIVPLFKEDPNLVNTGELAVQGLNLRVPGYEKPAWFQGRDVPNERILEPTTPDVATGGGTAVATQTAMDPARLATLQDAAPAFATRTTAVVDHLQKFIDEVQTNPAYAEGGMDVPAQVDAAQRLIRGAYDGLERQAAFARGAEVAPDVRLADTMRLQELEQTAPGMLTAGLSPQQVLERAYMPMRKTHGAIAVDAPDGSVAWQGGPPVSQMDDLVHDNGVPQPTYFPHMDATRLSPSDFFTSKKLVGANPAARNPHMEATRGILLERNTYLKDPIAVAKRASARAVREEETFALWDGMTKRFGTAVANASDIPRGYVAVAPDALRLNYRSRMIMFDRVDELTAQGVSREDAVARALSETMAANHETLNALAESGGAKIYAVPKIVADRLNDAARYSAVFNTKAVQLFWDKPMQAWRSITLFGSPRFILNNTIGNTAFALMQGVKLGDVVKIFDAKFKEMASNWVLRHQGLPETATLEEGSLAAQVQKLPGYDELGSGFVGNAVEQYAPQLSADAAATRTGRLYERLGASKVAGILHNSKEAYAHLNQVVEDSYREASFLTEAERAAGISTVRRTGRVFMDSENRIQSIMDSGFTEAKGRLAVDGANSFFGDYASMSPFERHVVRRFIFPFWGFYRHQLGLLVRFPFQYPLRAEVMQHLGQANQEMIDQYGPIPSWLDSAIPMGAPGNVTEFYNPRGADPFSGSFQAPVSQINPILKDLIERGTGRSLYTGQPFSDAGVASGYGSDMRFDANGNPVGNVLPSLPEQLLQNVPLYNTLKQAVAGGKTYDTATLIDALQGQALETNASGEPVKQMSPGDVLAQYLGLGTTQTDLNSYQQYLEEQRQAALKTACSSAKPHPLDRIRPDPPGGPVAPAPPSLPTLDELAARARRATAQGLASQAGGLTSPIPTPFSPMPLGTPSLGTPSIGGQTAPFSVSPTASAMPFGGYGGGAQAADNMALGKGVKPGSLRGAPGVVKLAATQLGMPYVFGAENPGGSFDCSGLTKWAYSRMGVDLPHSAEGQMQTTMPVDASHLKPGMLVYFNFGRLAAGTADHVMIYAGHGRAIGAQPSTGGVGFYNDIFSMPEVIGYGAVPGVTYSHEPRRTPSSSSPTPTSHSPSHVPSPSPQPSPHRAPTQRQAVSQKQMSGVGRRI